MFWLAAPRLPMTVERLLEHWAGELGDLEQAQRQWSMLHGSIMLGQSSARSDPPPRSDESIASEPIEADDITLL
jgi:hypothetical protein